jgi:hypothetical protein
VRIPSECLLRKVQRPQKERRRIPDHSAFTRARNERFRDGHVFRRVFEHVVTTCMLAGLVGGKGFAVDASLIAADANKCRSTPGNEWSHDIDPDAVGRAVQDYLNALDDPAWGAATDVTPKFVAPADPAAQWTGALRNAAFFAYADNYLIDVEHGIVVDVEASRAIRQSEVGASQTMIERTEACFGLKPDWLVADTAYGSAGNLGWLVEEKDIAPHIPVIDKSKRDDGTFSREDFIYDAERDCYVCPAGADLTTNGRLRDDGMYAYLASVNDCRTCPLKSRCCPKTPQRKVTRSKHEAARDVARAIAKTEAYEESRRMRKGRDVVCAFETHPAAQSAAAAWTERCPVRVHPRGQRPEPAPPRQAHGPRSPSDRLRVRCVSVSSVRGVGCVPSVSRPAFRMPLHSERGDRHRSRRHPETPLRRTSATKSAKSSHRLRPILADRERRCIGRNCLQASCASSLPRSDGCSAVLLADSRRHSSSH